MLLSNECTIIQSLHLALTFDDGKVKERDVSVGDLCSFEYIKNGLRKKIEGVVVKIIASETISPNTWMIMVDGSLDYAGQIEKFRPNQVVDVDVIRKKTDKQYIGTPNDSTHISEIRFYDGYLQLSLDGGYTWMTPRNIKYPFYAEEDHKHVDHCEGHHRHHRKKTILVDNEDDEEDEGDDTEIPDEFDINGIE